MEVIINTIQRIDAGMALWLNNTLHNDIFNLIMPLFDRNTNWMAPLMLLWLGVMLFGGKRGRWIGAIAVVLVVITDQVSSSIIKPLIGRSRPCNVISGLHFWVNGEWFVIPNQIDRIYKKSLSFPSSHAVNSAAQALWWGWFYPRTRYYWLVLVMVIGFSRIYIGVHYPGDILGGWIIGAVCFGMVLGVVRKWGVLEQRKGKG